MLDKATESLFTSNPVKVELGNILASEIRKYPLLLPASQTVIPDSDEK